MAAFRAVVRYSFTETKEGDRRTTAIITATIPGKSFESALTYLLKKYPERHLILNNLSARMIWNFTKLTGFSHARSIQTGRRAQRDR